MPLVPVEDAEPFLDCTGAVRRFRVGTYAEGRFLEARELRDDGAGLRFVLPVPLDGEPPYGELRRRVRERLSQRDLAVDPACGLTLLRDLVRGQLHDAAGGGPPVVAIDDRLLTWEELGALLAPYAGFGLRIELVEVGTE